MRRFIAVAFVVAAACAPALHAQSPLDPSVLTNRRMGFVNDPSAVAWNPALLGLRTQSDFLAAVPQLDGRVHKLAVRVKKPAAFSRSASTSSKCAGSSYAPGPVLHPPHLPRM